MLLQKIMTHSRVRPAFSEESIWEKQIRKIIKSMTSHKPEERPAALEALGLLGQVIQ